MYALQVDIARVRKVVAEVHGEVQASKAKWNDLGRRLDAIDAFFSAFFAAQGFGAAAPLAPSPGLGFAPAGYYGYAPRRSSEYGLDERRRDGAQ